MAISLRYSRLPARTLPTPTRLPRYARNDKVGTHELDGDVDFLREVRRVLVEGIMDAAVSAQIGAQHGERSPTAPPIAAEIGAPGWGRWSCASPRSERVGWTT